MTEFAVAALDHATLRSAGKELLSLALIDARNHTLRWAAALEAAAGGAALTLAGELAPGVADELDPALWTLGHVGWFQEHWIARNMQCGRGERADPTRPRLASAVPRGRCLVRPGAGRPRPPPRARRRRAARPAGDPRLARRHARDDARACSPACAVEDDASLYFHRLALFHEEMHVEAFAVLAQSLGIDTGLVARIATAAPRPPLLFPATRWLLGTSGAGFRFDNEAEPHPVDVPEFEIDAQAVTWAQFGEFVEDGGYDERVHWSDAGWDWLQREGRRTPRHVDQMRHGVLQRRFGVLARVAAAHPAVHVSWHEADAWCRWADRRLPGEVEWEAAAHQGATRGFRWGDVREWTATTFAPIPASSPGPWRDYSLPAFGTHKVLRGASFATRPSLVSARFRGFARAERDDGFFGFRSCAK